MKLLKEKYVEQLMEEAKILGRFIDMTCYDEPKDLFEKDVRRVAMQSELVAVIANNLLREMKEKDSAYA